jgi:hypothetical protein
MLVVVEVAHLLQGEMELEVLEAVAMVVKVVLLVQPILVAVVAVDKEAVELDMLVALAVLASLSFHTQAQHNYLVVELLPNQAVTSFTHLHLLAHLALCHL